MKFSYPERWSADSWVSRSSISVIKNVSNSNLKVGKSLSTAISTVGEQHWRDCLTTSKVNTQPWVNSRRVGVSAEVNFRCLVSCEKTIKYSALGVHLIH